MPTYPERSPLAAGMPFDQMRGKDRHADAPRKREEKRHVVAGGGLEPPDLQGMNLASYQLLHPALMKYSMMEGSDD